MEKYKELMSATKFPKRKEKIELQEIKA